MHTTSGRRGRMAIHIERLKFLATLAGAAAAWPLAARAQQAMPVIGFLLSQSADALADRVRAFRQGLKETGYVDGESLATEFRWIENEPDRLPALVADLIRRQVTVIAAMEPPGCSASQSRTSCSLPPTTRALTGTVGVSTHTITRRAEGSEVTVGF